MQNIVANSRSIEFWLTIIIGLFTMYVGLQVRKRKNWPERIKLKPFELLVAFLLMGVDSFFFALAHFK